MKEQQFQYSYKKMLQNTSPIKTHLLASVLPYQDNKNQQHFLKNKQFYKPQQFIWNNPHRTSKRLYPYYHQSNEEYQLKIKPIIQKLQQQDKIHAEQERIKKLTSLRAQTRQKFFQRQKNRQHLQAKSNSKNKVKSTIDAEPHSYRLYRNSHITTLKINLTRQSNSKQILANIQKTYLKGVKKYEDDLCNIRKLVIQQVIKNHDKIKFQFQKRKENNDQINTSINRIRGRKSVGTFKHDNYFD